jgi:hypothetical protein
MSLPINCAIGVPERRADFERTRPHDAPPLFIAWGSTSQPVNEGSHAGPSGLVRWTERAAPFEETAASDQYSG